MQLIVSIDFCFWVVLQKGIVKVFVFFVDMVEMMLFQICDLRFSELIPCLDRNLIYQLKLKLNLSLMEHYERHCPPPARQYNCLVPPPSGYKVGGWHCSCRSIV